MKDLNINTVVSVAASVLLTVCLCIFQDIRASVEDNSQQIHKIIETLHQHEITQTKLQIAAQEVIELGREFRQLSSTLEETRAQLIKASPVK